MNAALPRSILPMALVCLLTACPPATPPAELSVTPASLNLIAGDAPSTLSAALKNSSATITWSLAGEGSLTATTGSLVQYVPPAALAAQAAATIIVSAGPLARTIAVTLKPRPNLFVNPENPTLSAGGPPFTFTARLEHASGDIAWVLSGPGSLDATTGVSVHYTPPTALPDATAATLTANAAGLSASVTIALAPVQTGIVLNPLAATLTAGDPPANFNAALTGSSEPISWALTGPGSLDATTGVSVHYTPPATLSAEASATLTASGAGLSRSALITVRPRPSLAVAITSPTGTVYARETVTVQVNVSGGAPESVELLRDGSTLATLVPPYQYTWNVTNETEGVHQLSARAHRGTETFDSGAKLTVVVDRTPPAITARMPAPNATDVARTTPISLTFSEALDPASLTEASLTLSQNGANAARTAQLSSDGRTITIVPATNPEPTIAYAIALSNLRDRAGNAVSASWSWTVPDWLELGQLSVNEHYTCSQLKLDPTDRPVVYCGAFIGGIVQGFVRRLTSGVWETLGGGAFNTDLAQSVQTVRLALKADGTPVVAWAETSGATNVIYVKELRAGGWFALGGPLNIDLTRPLNESYNTPELDLALDAGGSPVVAFIEARSEYVRRYQSGTWTTLGGGTVPTAIPNPAAGPSKPKILVAADGSVHAFWEMFYGPPGVSDLLHQRWNGSWTNATGFSSYWIFDYEPFSDSSSRLFLKLGTGKAYLYYGTSLAVQRLDGTTPGTYWVSTSGQSIAYASGAAMGVDGNLATIHTQSRTGYPNFAGYDVLVNGYKDGVFKQIGGALEGDATISALYAPVTPFIAIDSTNTPVVGLATPSRLLVKRYNR